MKKIGVFVCHCGLNIARTVDVKRVTEEIGKEPGVVVSEEYPYMCSDPGQNLIKEKMREHSLDRVVVASCSPTLHEPTFMRVVASEGMNKYCFEMANIREHCSWVHGDIEEATAKAIAIIRSALAKARLLEALDDFQVPVTSEALVIGAGIAGIQSALDIADAGYKVYLIDKDPSIGGHMAQLDKTFPTLDCSACILTPKMVDVSQHENIELLTYSEVESVDGFVGNFKVKIRKKSPYVDWSKCNGCSECDKVCPVNLPSEFQVGLTRRTAIYRPFPQAVPNKFTINKIGTPPCRFKCPAGVNAQGYVALVSKGKFKEALALEREANPFASICGRTCTHPCETACKRGEFDEPLSIRAIKRFIADYETEVPKPDLPEQKDEKVAIIGSGPSGLTCAYKLAREGYQTTVFEALPVAGGMTIVGIPPFRLPREEIKRDIDYIKSWGVDIKVNSRIEDPEKLLQEGYKAVYIATGAYKERRLGVDGEDLDGVIYGLDFLEQANLHKTAKVGKRVGVVGGGNSAIDAARVALRLGAEEVTIIYRRSRVEMPADEEEIEAALEEGIKIHYLANPTRFIGENGKLKQMECIKMELGAPDSSGRRRPVPKEGSEFLVDVDTVIPTIGQTPDTSFLPKDSNIKIIEKWSSFAADEVTLQTSVPGIFAGGDCVTGPASIVEAVQAGQEAAISIDRFIRGIDINEGREREEKQVEDVVFPPPYMKQKREDGEHLPVDDRIRSIEEVSKGLTEEQVIKEASRCLGCGGCIECGECSKVCEPDAIIHDMEDEIIEKDVGAIVVATGYDQFDPSLKPELGYKDYERVISGLEFERLVSPSGPTGGEILICGEKPKKVVLLHCVGSRDQTVCNEYCSRVCCMYLAKHAHLIKEKIPKAQVTCFYMDVRAFGKGYEEFYDRVREEGILYRRGSVSEIFKRKGKLIVKGEDTLLGEPVEEEADLVVLGTGIVPRFDAEKMGRILKIVQSQDKFFLEAHPKLRPVDTFSEGIFLAGCCQGPKDIPDTVAQAKAAASSAVAILSKNLLTVAPIVAIVDEDVCAGCKSCEAVCDFSAHEFNEREKVMTINTILCKGCGNCVTTCPSSAIRLNSFTNNQILAQIDSILEGV